MEKLAGIIAGALLGWLIVVSMVLSIFGVFGLFIALATPNPVLSVLHIIILYVYALIYSILYAIPFAILPSILLGLPLWIYAESKEFVNKNEVSLLGIIVAYFVLLVVNWASNGYSLDFSTQFPGIFIIALFITPVGLIAGNRTFDVANDKRQKRLQT